MMKKLILAAICIQFFGACNTPQKWSEEPIEDTISHFHDLKLQAILDSTKLEGSMLISEANGQDTFVYNSADFDTPRTPASTFKIFNSLVGLETGVIKDENFVIKWDGQKRWNAKWNEDHDLKKAYKNSAVWYYQELARRVGGKDMKMWLDKVGYGNADTSGGIDQFWLNNHLRITIRQQVEFMKRLHNNELPFSQRTMDIVKKIMIAEDTNGYVLRAKTGWGNENEVGIGWYVGYLTNKNKVYYFANCVLNKQKSDTTFFQNRILIAREGLRQAGAFTTK